VLPLARALLDAARPPNRESGPVRAHGTIHPCSWETTMQQDLVHKVKSNPKYHELVSKRSSFGWFMAILMLVIYYGFILIIAYAPSFLAQPIGAGWTMTVGIPIGVGVILAAFALTGIFIQRANTVFDDLSNQIKEEVL